MSKASYKIETQTRVGASPQYRWIYTNAHGNQWIGPKLGTPELAREDFRDWWKSRVPASAKRRFPPEISEDNSSGNSP